MATKEITFKNATDEMTTLTETINLLRSKGYNDDFELTTDGLKSKLTREIFTPRDLLIEKVYRFEGQSDPADMAVLYGISAKGKAKGILIDAYGTYDNKQLAELLKDVEISNNEH